MRNIHNNKQSRGFAAGRRGRRPYFAIHGYCMIFSHSFPACAGSIKWRGSKGLSTSMKSINKYDNNNYAKLQRLPVAASHIMTRRHAEAILTSACLQHWIPHVTIDNLFIEWCTTTSCVVRRLEVLFLEGIRWKVVIALYNLRPMEGRSKEIFRSSGSILGTGRWSLTQNLSL